MGDYLAIFTSSAAPGGAIVLAQMKQRLEAEGLWSAAAHGDDFHVWTTAGRPPVRPLRGGGVLIGDIYAKRTGARLAAVPGTPASGVSPEKAARALAEYAWGAYVAIWPEPCGGVSIWRDPSGALEALVWRAQGLTFCTSSLQAPQVADLLPKTSIDWGRIGAFLCNPSEIGWGVALDGLDAVSPGVLRREATSGKTDTVIWTPAGAASQPWEQDRSVRTLAWELEATLDRCVSAELRATRSLCEISGGLDSACIGSCAKQSAADVAAWLNYVGGEAEGDERAFARAVARRLDVSLTEVAKPVAPLSGVDLVARCFSARPPLNAMDAGYDDDVARRLREAGAHGVITGQGGDIVFDALATSEVMDDAIRRCGWRARVSPFARVVARTQQVSMWSFVRRGSGSAPSQASGLAPLSWTAPMLVADYRPDHGWLIGLDDFAAAKRLQLQAFARTLLFHGDCVRSRAGRLIHGPLLQPVVELCLKIPADMLAASGISRGLVRRAFAARLPADVIRRQAKGDLTSAYGRELAADLAFVRGFLLDGRLSHAGVLDREALEADLSREAFVWRGAFADVSDLMAIEGWVRAWEDRPLCASARRTRG